MVIGSKLTIDAAVNGDAKMVVLAANCPKELKTKIASSTVPVLNYPGTNVELGPACGKPFTIAALAIIDAGESDILAVV